MDLKTLLAANKSKTERSNLIRKPVAIADQDRPYSVVADIYEVKAQPATPPSPLPPHQYEKLRDDKDQKPLTLNQESNNKVATKWQQTENKVATQPATNREQSGNKVATQPQQAVNKISNKNRKWQQSGNTTGNKTGNKVATNREQSGNKVATKTMFSALVGLQRDIVIFICHECKNSRSRITEALTLEHISEGIKHSAGAVKTTIQRLEKKGCLTRVEFKNGRGGWSRYEVPDPVYHDALRNESGNKVATNREQSGNKVASQLATEPATSLSSSSSVLNIKETTTTELSDEWNFDITPYRQFGFTISQIKQLAALNVITAMDVEQSLIEFSYDLENDSLPDIKTGKINFLMGLFRSGHSYVSEGFKNEQQAMISEMARRAEDKRKVLLEEKFKAWENMLSDEERGRVAGRLPTHLIALHRLHGVDHTEIRNWYFDYFMQNVKE